MDKNLAVVRLESILISKKMTVVVLEETDVVEVDVVLEEVVVVTVVVEVEVEVDVVLEEVVEVGVVLEEDEEEDNNSTSKSFLQS